MAKTHPRAGEPRSRQVVKGRRITEKFACSQDTSEEIERAAAEDGYTKSAFLGRLVKRYLDERKDQQKLNRKPRQS